MSLCKTYRWIITALVWSLTLTSAAGQYKKAEEKFFGNIDADEIFDTPAFKKKGFTNYAELLDYISDLENLAPDLVTLDWIGSTQKGKRIPIIILGRENRQKKLRIWYQGGVHGNEPASTEGLLHFLKTIIKEPSYHALFEEISLAVIPMVNIDGYILNRRQLSNGYDLNRDQAKLSTLEAVVMRTAFTDFSPHVSIDFHEFNPYRADFRTMDKLGTTSYYDFMFLPSNNPNQTPVLHDLTHDLFIGDAQKHMTELGFRHTTYTTVSNWHGYRVFNTGGTNARSSSSAYALTNTVSMLMEIRGVNLGRQNFERRVFITKELAMRYLLTGHKNLEHIKSKIEESLQYVMTTLDPVIINSEADIEDVKLKMIDLNTLEAKDYDVLGRNRANQKILVQRPRAEGYYIDASYGEAIEKLKLFGFSLTKLESSKQVKCEVYRINNLKIDHNEFEEIYPLDVEVSLETNDVLLPPDTYFVSTRQKNGQLLGELLEPDASNSFVRMRIIPLDEITKYKVYRMTLSNSSTP